MFELHLIILIGFLEMAYFIPTENDPDLISTLDSPKHNVLPLVLIKKGRNFIHPTKIMNSSTSSAIERSHEQLEFSGDFGEQQILLCGAKPPPKWDAERPYTSSVDEYCNYPIKFEKSDPLKCVYEPEPLLIPLTIPKTSVSLIKSVSCGPNNEGKIYHFAYKICVTEKEIDYKKYSSADFRLADGSIIRYDKFEIYKICVEEKTMEVFFTEHRIFSPRLLNDQRLTYEREKMYDFRSAKNLRPGKEILQSKDESTEILSALPTPEASTSMEESEDSEYVMPIHIIDKYVPSDDFAFALWRKPTFDFLNMEPMTMEQLKLWHYIGELIRKDAIKHNREYYVHTTVQELHSTESMSKHGPNQVKAMNVWVKIVYQLPDEIPKLEDFNDKNKAIAIIMDNDSDTDLQTYSMLETRFGKNLCVNTFKTMQIRSIRCSSMINIATYLNQSGIEIDEDLQIESLYDNEDNDDRERPWKKIKRDFDLNLAL